MFLHPYAEIFPGMTDEELKELTTDIAKRGLLDPLTVYQGKILDGRNRQIACRDMGITPKTVEFQGTDEDALNFVMSKNLKRRNLTSSQKAVVGQEYEKLFADIAKERQKEALARGRETQAGANGKAERTDSDNRVRIGPQPSPKPKPAPRAVDRAAEIVGVSPAYISAAKKVKKADPALAEEVKRGTVSLPEATRRVKAKEQPKPAKSPKPASSTRFDPGRRWQRTTFPMLASELGRWPKSFHQIFISYLREWATTIEKMQ